MRPVNRICIVLLLTWSAALGSVLAADKPPAVEDKLAETGFTLGDEVEAITDYRLDDRVYLDGRHLIVPDDSSRSYLVSLDKKCYGLAANRLYVETRTRYQLAPRDKLSPQHEGRNVDRCEVVSIHQLIPR
jgi:hypothetical protein